VIVAIYIRWLEGAVSVRVAVDQRERPGDVGALAFQANKDRVNCRFIRRVFRLRLLVCESA